MLKLKEYEKFFGEQCHRSENGQYLMVKACIVGNNFYDYDEEPKTITFEHLPTKLKNEIQDDKRIKIISCDCCCECSGW